LSRGLGGETLNADLPVIGFVFDKYGEGKNAIIGNPKGETILIVIKGWSVLLEKVVGRMDSTYA